MITYEEAVKAQDQIESKLLLDPNVVSIGVVEETNYLGQKTGNYVVQVGVTSTEIYKSNLQHGQSVIPKECIIHSDDNSSIEQHVRIHVVKEGKIEALVKFNPHTEKNDLPSAIDDISGSSPLLHDYTSRLRPSPGGFSIGHYRVTAGTNETIKVSYTSRLVVFKNQIRTTSMSQGGDSGSCLFERGSRKPVGLLFAGGETGSFHNPFDTVLSSLSKSHTNQYAGGVKHHFGEDYPLKILKVGKREFSTFSPAHYATKKLQVGKSSTLSSPSQYKMFTPQFLTASSMQNTVKMNKHIPTAMKSGALLASIGVFAAATIMAKPIAAFRQDKPNLEL